ncbi:MAG: hypothetical protein Q7T05_05585 [Dehalococcoidia bacterium]|nr:hypothetical protein [Dehalococcoidia bacterium]
MNWKQFIAVMKVDERAASAKYRLAAKAAENLAIKDVFEKLAAEEEVHIGVLTDFERDLKALLAEDKQA